MGDKGRKKPDAQVLNIFQDGAVRASPAGYLPEQGLPEEVRHIFGELARNGAKDSSERQKIL